MKQKIVVVMLGVLSAYAVSCNRGMIKGTGVIKKKELAHINSLHATVVANRAVYYKRTSAVSFTNNGRGNVIN